MKPIDVLEVFLAFRNQCVWTRTCFNIYTDLYESTQDTLDLMEAKAPAFFQDLNTILIEYCLIQISKHLDPKETSGKSNLTVAYLDSELETALLMSPEIQALSTNLTSYRTRIKDARDKILSHTDRDTALLNRGLGAHAKEELQGFFGNLQLYCDAVGNVLGEGPLDFRATPAHGDAIDLLRCLK